MIVAVHNHVYLIISIQEVSTEDKGRGAVAEHDFKMVTWYAVICKLIAMDEAQKRTRTYKKELGSYLFYFQHDGKDLWFVDSKINVALNCLIATEEDGALINHSKLHPNVIAKVVASDIRPYLRTLAATSIETGQELLYDYGERSKAAIENFTWLKSDIFSLL